MTTQLKEFDASLSSLISLANVLGVSIQLGINGK